MNFKTPWIIAEIGSVHDGSLGNAQKLIEAAAQSGANFVKFQTHIPEAETLRDAPAPGYFKAEDRFSYFHRTGFTKEQWIELKEHCEKNNVGFLSSPFSLEAVDLLEEVGVGAYKIPSGEVTNIPLLEYIAQTKKPVLLSSGMSDWKEIDQAVKALEGVELCLMQCTSAYPCPPEKVGLNVLFQMKERYPHITLGYSDHTLGPAAAISAATIGARIIEKHFTFSQLMYGSDAKHSMEPRDFKNLCQWLEETWKTVEGQVNKDDLSEVLEMKKIFQKSLVAAKDLEEGTTLTREMLAFKKPGDGISAAHYKDYIGKTLSLSVQYDHKFSEGDFK